ncbi:major capsid protein [Maridesulfovibrio bastinii]|uniref:major capsid protein n=1 Tax=Maridesulfovibrio bastinii TaxID=47157 RepID=UPI00041D9914|nr:major capsid protein [Maridesulfovibrio bastinii]
MSLELRLRRFYTAAAIRNVLKTVAAQPQTIKDTVFTNRSCIHSPVIPLAELKKVIKNMPVVARNGQPINVASGNLEAVYVEPLPVKLFSDIDPVMLSNLKMLTDESLRNYANGQIVDLRESTNLTTEALCSQALFDGKISYQLQVDSAKSKLYTVSYGSSSIQEVAVSKQNLWNADDVSRTVVLSLLRQMDNKLTTAGYPGQRKVYAGITAFGHLLDLVDQNKDSRTPMRIKEDGSVQIGKFVVLEMSEVYYGEDGNPVPKVPDSEIRMVTPQYTVLKYAAIDDLDANLQALPLFLKAVKDEKAGSLQNISNSKPLPGVAPGSTCKAVVVSEAD